MKKICAISLVLVMMLLCSCSLMPTQNNISLNSTAITINVGDTSSLLVSSSQNFNDSTIRWSSSNNNVATVDNGTVKGISEGTAVITAVSQTGESAYCNVTVQTAPITSLKIRQKPASMKVGDIIQINVSVKPDAAEGDLEWTSSNNSVAVVDSSGYVTAVSEGVVNIKCTAPNGKNASCTIKVVGEDRSSNSTTIYYTPSQIGQMYSSEFVFYDSSYRKLTDYEVKYLSSTEVQKAINEIYARNGYVFQNDTIKAYYDATTWYYPNPDFTTNDFNSVEKYNIALLQKYR